MAEDMQLTIKVAMESQSFQQQINNINRQMRVVQSEFATASSRLGEFGSVTDRLRGQSSSLSQQLDLGRQKVTMLQEAQEKARQTLERNVQANQQLEARVNATRQALEESVRATGQNSAESIRLREELTSLERQYSNSQNTINNSVRTLDNYTLRVNDAQRNVNNLERQLQETDRELEVQSSRWTQLGRIMQNVSDTARKVGDKMKDVGKTLSMAVTAPLVGAGVASVKLASDLAESTNKVEVAFGKNAKGVEDWSNKTLTSFGIAKGSALDMAALFGDMGTAMGQSTQEASKMSMNLVGLAGDLASFKNIGLAQAQDALKGIFTGEGESLKSLGVVMQDSTLEAYALATGQKKQYDEMSQAEKVALRYSFVMNATKNAQGDFARTSDGTANQMRIFQESLKQLGATMGQELLPIVTPIIAKLNEWVQKFGELDEKTKKIILVVAGVTAVIGPAIVIIGTLITSVATITGAFATASVAIAEAGGIIALLTSPVGIAVGSVAGLIAIGVALYRNWDEIKAKASSLKSTTVSTFNSIKTGIETPINSAKDTVKKTIDSIKGFFANLKLPEIKIPKIKLPHFNLTGSFSLSPPSVPKLNVNWYSGGAIFTRPTVLNGVGDANNGKGSNAEAVLPLNVLWKQLNDNFDRLADRLDKNNGINLNIEKFYNDREQTVQAFLEEIEFLRNQYSRAKGGGY